MSISIAHKLDSIFSQIAESSGISGIEYRQLTQEPILCALGIIDKTAFEKLSINRLSIAIAVVASLVYGAYYLDEEFSRNLGISSWLKYSNVEINQHNIAYFKQIQLWFLEKENYSICEKEIRKYTIEHV